MPSKLSIPCRRCDHKASQHFVSGIHECLVNDCECNYFVVPKDVDDINTPESYEMTFGKMEPLTDNDTSIIQQNVSDHIDIQKDPSPIDKIANDIRQMFDGSRNRDEIRTVASTGAEKGVKEARYDLIPVPALDLLARLYGKGAAKYAAHNWRRGYEWSKSYAAALRHMTLFWEGEDIDPEMQLPHVICASFHMFTLATYMTEHPEMDDRFHTVMAREAAEQEEGLSEEDLDTMAAFIADLPAGSTPFFAEKATVKDVAEVYRRASLIEKEETPALTTVDILEELANDYINRGNSRTAKTLLAVARDEKVK